MRRSKEGWPPVVKIGYARPKARRGEHPSGLVEVLVWRPKDLGAIDPKTQAARIAHSVGERKRVEIIDQAKKANIRVLNPGTKKEAEITPEAPAEPTAPSEPTAAPEPAAEATSEATAEATTEPLTETETKAEAKETETTKGPPKKRTKGKKTKKRTEK